MTTRLSIDASNRTKLLTRVANDVRAHRARAVFDRFRNVRGVAPSYTFQLVRTRTPYRLLFVIKVQTPTGGTTLIDADGQDRGKVGAKPLPVEMCLDCTELPELEKRWHAIWEATKGAEEHVVRDMLRWIGPEPE